ncbi:MAG TPA: N-6 DNA methylase [Solirubrobacteraceae bacterium]|nr:N-6 DNA methylase [Solirubrobacteraceae bacterium]
MTTAGAMSDFEHETVRRSIWAAANTMRAAGLNTLDTIEHLGFLLFLRLVTQPESELPASATRLHGLLEHADVVERCAGERDAARWFNQSFFPTFRDRVEEEFASSPVRFVVQGFEPKIEDSPTLLRVLQRTEAMSLDHAHVDINAAVYEQLIATLGDAGHLGQYFTPRHIVDLMVDMVDPRPGESVYDPAAGTGGFLLRTRAATHGPDSPEELALHGRELNTIVRRLCVLNFLIHGADPAHLADGDSLTARNEIRDRFDIVLTNPPFGAAITNRDDLCGFAVSTTSAEALFLQHVVASLAEDGRAAVVCPEGLLTNLGTDRQLRRWLLRTAQVEAVVSLPSGVFQPYAAVRTGIVLLRKAGSTGSVWFFDVEHDGFDLNARRKPNGSSDLPELREGLAAKAEGPQSALVAAADLEESDFRLVAARYIGQSRSGSCRHRMLPLGDLVRIRREQLNPSAFPEQLFLCLGLEHIEGQTGHIDLPAPVPGSAIRSAKSRFRAGDLLYGKLRPYLAKAAQAPCDGICSTELVVLEVDAARVEPAFLAAMLRSPEITEQATRLMVGANHPRIAVKDLIRLRLPVPVLSEQHELVAQLAGLEAEITSATTRIADLRRDVTSTVGALWGRASRTEGDTARSRSGPWSATTR